MIPRRSWCAPRTAGDGFPFPPPRLVVRAQAANEELAEAGARWTFTKEALHGTPVPLINAAATRENADSLGARNGGRPLSKSLHTQGSEVPSGELPAKRRLGTAVPALRNSVEAGMPETFTKEAMPRRASESNAGRTAKRTPLSTQKVFDSLSRSERRRPLSMSISPRDKENPARLSVVNCEAS